MRPGSEKGLGDPWVPKISLNCGQARTGPALKSESEIESKTDNSDPGGSKTTMISRLSCRAADHPCAKFRSLEGVAGSQSGVRAARKQN